MSLFKLETYRQKLIIGFGDYERITAMLDYNVMQTMQMQARINASESKEFWDKNLKGIKKLSYLYYIYMHPSIMRILSVLTAILSLALLYAEFTNFINIKESFFHWIF